MSFNRYYQDELAFLRELGAEFANRNPALMPFLSREAIDPDVERLLEGFAFLTGRIRQKLDDELPELSHSLASVLWPNLLRPIPPMAIVEFEPLIGVMSGTQIVPAGSEVESRPLEGTSCRFTSVSDLSVHPLSVTQAEFSSVASTSQLSISLHPLRGSDPEGILIDPLRIHLAFERDQSMGRLLLSWLLTRLKRVDVQREGDTIATLPAKAVKPVGFRPDESLLPVSAQSFPGHVLLQEYFAFPQKFMFIDVHGLNALHLNTEDNLILSFIMDGIPNAPIRVTNANLRINCVPMINLFPHEAIPLDVDHMRTEYRILPSGSDPFHYSVFSVEKVIGLHRAHNRRTEYVAFEKFLEGISNIGSSLNYYYTRTRPAVSRAGVETFISLVNDSISGSSPESEVVSLGLSCTNGQIASGLPIGSLTRATVSSPTFASFRNISVVSPEVLPPLDAKLLWRVIANLGVTQQSLARIDSLRLVIGTFDFAALADQRAQRRLQLLLESLRTITANPTDLIENGRVLRGLEIDIGIEESKLGGEGEAFLLGAILDGFFAEASNVNGFHRLQLHGMESNWQNRWPIRTGNGPLL